MDKILLVEDDQSLIEIYTITFNHENLILEVARDGEECLQKAKAVKPDLILLDVMMPKMNGIQALEQLKSNEETKNIPVIMLSNIAESNQQKRATELGAVQYLIKSHYLPMEIVAMAKNALLKKSIH